MNKAEFYKNAIELLKDSPQSSAYQFAQTELEKLGGVQSVPPPSVPKPQTDIKTLITDLKLTLKYTTNSDKTKTQKLIEDLELASKYA